MKTIRILLITILLFVPTLLLAQENVVEIDEEVSESESTPIVEEKEKAVISKNQYFELELIRGVQNPLTKTIPFTLRITPKVKSEKTQILWSVPSTLSLKTLHREFVSLESGNTYTYKVKVSPKREGTYDITANIVSWQYDINYTNSVSSTITLSPGFVVQPVDAEYTISLLLIILVGIGLLGAGGFFAYRASGTLLKKLKAWLTPPV
ncbi:MAG: hypothetical protein ACOX0X_00015 [Candidatus Dojkabacteria bacterium]|jgi:hypothetical protein